VHTGTGNGISSLESVRLTDVSTQSLQSAPITAVSMPVCLQLSVLMSVMPQMI